MLHELYTQSEATEMPVAIERQVLTAWWQAV